MKNVYLLFLIFSTTTVYADKIPGLNIKVYQQLSGLYSESKKSFDTSKWKELPETEFSWGYERIPVNTLAIIDPADNSFMFPALHMMQFKSFKQIDADTIDIELFFKAGNIQRYRIHFFGQERRSIHVEDNGSTAKYSTLEKDFTKLMGPDPKKGRYGHIVGKDVRIRTEPNLKGEILDLLQEKDTLFTIKQSETKDTIDGETWSWVKVVTDTGCVGWVFEKYIIIDNKAER